MSSADMLKQRLINRLETLSASRLQELLDFADFLSTKEPGGEDPLLHVAGCLSGTPLSAAEIEEELYGEDPA